jgi:predicted SnoaL-like aldol condensation-catalyzing enzyme
MSHKEIASEFLRLAASGKVDEAYVKYVSTDFIHHNQYFKGDRDSLMKGMKDAAISAPNKSFHIKHIYEDLDRVITHSLVDVQGGMKIAVVHIFKMAGNKIVEMWDIGQQIMADSPNENGLF